MTVTRIRETYERSRGVDRHKNRKYNRDGKDDSSYDCIAAIHHVFCYIYIYMYCIARSNYNDLRQANSDHCCILIMDLPVVTQRLPKLQEKKLGERNMLKLYLTERKSLKVLKICISPLQVARFSHESLIVNRIPYHSN